MAQLSRFELMDDLHGSVPCAVLVPDHVAGPFPLCLFLYGGGGSRESLAEIASLLDGWWRAGELPPLLVATPDVGPWSFYLDDPARHMGWESFVLERFVPSLQKRSDVARGEVALVGISMGGQAALKLAFARPGTFAAVAAVSPMLEPALEAGEVPLRNRYHYPPEVPQALLGPVRDAALYRRDQPVHRACANARALRDHALAIYLDSAGADVLHAHDGAEFLHRVLWDLDIPHEYRVRRDADHVGPELLERLHEAFRWVGEHVAPAAAAPLDAHERAWEVWLTSDRTAPPPAPLPPTSRLFTRVLRAQLEPLRRAAERLDASFSRRHGRLPGGSSPVS